MDDLEEFVFLTTVYSYPYSRKLWKSGFNKHLTYGKQMKVVTRQKVFSSSTSGFTTGNNTHEQSAERAAARGDREGPWTIWIGAISSREASPRSAGRTSLSGGISINYHRGINAYFLTGLGLGVHPDPVRNR